MKKMGLIFFLIQCLVLLVPKNLAEAQQVNSCILCHREIAELHGESVHAERGVSCKDCHGGDPLDPELSSMSKAKGFKGKPSKVEMVYLCGSCHADPVRMKPYGIPTGQFSEYKTSQHGIRLLKNGDENVAGCTDCHEKHRILAVNDPRCSVYKINVPKTCAKCHSDPSMMKPYNLSTLHYAQYVASVHGKALLEKGNKSAPECANCHGTHGAMPPGVTSVADVCGQCHSNTRNYFNQSPHKKAMDEKLMSECVSCHKSHDVASSSLGLFETMCRECHSSDSPGFHTSQELKKMLLEVQTALEEAEKKVEEMKRKGKDVEREESLIWEAETRLGQVAALQHTLSLNDIKAATDKTMSILKEVRVRAESAIHALWMRKVALIFIWIGILFVVTLFYLKLKSLEREYSFRETLQSN